MAAAKNSRKKAGSTTNGTGRAKPRRARNGLRAAAPADIGADALRHLVKAPGDYAGIARQFADALARTSFRGEISPYKLRVRLARGELLAKRAADMEHKAVTADRQRMVHDSGLWKDILATWRLVVAAMPNHPELETSFAFMQEYMSTGRRSTPPSTPPAA